MEVTKWLKPSISVSRIGDSANRSPRFLHHRATRLRHTLAGISSSTGAASGSQLISIAVFECEFLAGRYNPIAEAKISRKIVAGQPQLSRFGETLAKLPFTGDHVVCLGHHPGRLERTCISHPAERNSLPIRISGQSKNTRLGL